MYCDPGANPDICKGSAKIVSLKIVCSMAGVESIEKWSHPVLGVIDDSSIVVVFICRKTASMSAGSK